MLMITVCLRLPFSLHIDDHQLTIKKSPQANCVTLVDKLDWECVYFEAGIKNIMILRLIFFHSFDFFLFLNCTLERNFALGSNTWKSQFVKQNLSISPEKDNPVVLYPFHINDRLALLINGIELHFFLKKFFILWRTIHFNFRFGIANVIVIYQSVKVGALSMRLYKHLAWCLTKVHDLWLNGLDLFLVLNQVPVNWILIGEVEKLVQILSRFFSFLLVSKNQVDPFVYCFVYFAFLYCFS